MHPDATMPAPGAPGNRDLDLTAARGTDPPQLGRALMAQHRAPSARQYRSHEVSEPVDITAPDCENPAMKAAKAARSEPVGNPALAQTELEELVPGDDTVLVPHEPPDLPRVLVSLDRYSGPR
jgi:hypothetical protein